MDESQMLVTALAEAAVLNRTMQALIRRLRANGTLTEAEVAGIKDHVLQELEEQRHDPAGPGAAAVDRMRERVERLLLYR